MSIHLTIPDSVFQAIRLPPGERPQRLKIELAVALYAQRILSFGKARELAEMSHYEFDLLLGKRKIERHYTTEDLQDDIAHACE